MLSRVPRPVTYGYLTLNPDCETLPGDPRFDALAAALAPAKK